MSTPVQAVHLVAGLPTENAEHGFGRLRRLFRLRSFLEFTGSNHFGDEVHSGIRLPPYIEPSQVVQDWEACNFLSRKMGRATQIGSVLTVVDAENLLEHLNASDPISARGWGQSPRDLRTVADIAVGQVESATHLFMVGPKSICESIEHWLVALNPTAVTLALDNSREPLSDESLRKFVFERRPARGLEDSAQVVPPWLELLRSESGGVGPFERILYRRSRPFDPERFGEWLADPQGELIRAKGKVWLANRADESFGYSGAGCVHRLFSAGRWWASRAGVAWPECQDARHRLLERWHPHFGDRRQEIAFVGVDLDCDQLCSQLDACLLSEREALDLLPHASLGSAGATSISHSAGLH